MTFTPRFLRSAGILELSGRYVKRYHLSVHDHDIEPTIVRAAEAILPRLVPTNVDDTPPASFMILHRGLESSYIVVYSWVWDNVVECHAATAGLPELGCPDRDPATFVVLERPWIGCVYELGAFEHERAAWVRHMFEAESPNLAAYLADTLTAGPIGGSRRGPDVRRQRAQP